MRLLTTKRFEKDIKRAGKRGKDIDKLWGIVEQLLSRQPLDPRNRPHRLSGDWSPYWECHIEPDWLSREQRLMHHLFYPQVGNFTLALLGSFNLVLTPGEYSGPVQAGA